MCGVLYSFNPRFNPVHFQEKVRQAIAGLIHRGPDENNIWSDGPCVVAHTRLSIIDLGLSHQPFTDPGNRYFLSYNGEIYNYQTLRKSLVDRWQFTTEGDTEVLFAGLILDGPDFVTRLEGMWAFAFWDRIENSLLLSRDRLGKKPLYYRASHDAFTACSELKPLLLIEDDAIKEDLNSTADYMRYGFFMPGDTIYEGIKEVLPGHNLSWKPGSEPQQHQYWQLRPGREISVYADALAQVRETMHQAVVKRMVADVEVGAFLSGGIDSSIVVALARQATSSTLKTFTMGFQDANFDESRYAKSVANQLGTEHYLQVLESWDPDLLRSLLANHVSQPFADPSLLPTALISQLASKKVKVALSGDGGDELFSGYQRYKARTMLRWYTRLPRQIKANVHKLINKLPEPAGSHNHGIIKNAHLFSATMDRMEDEIPYIAPMFFSNSQLSRLVPDIHTMGYSLALKDAPPCHVDEIQQMMHQDALIYLPQDVLVKVDRASMAYSLETRAPFLDHALVELAFSLPLAWHRRWFSGKQVLRDTFSGLFPEAFWKRRKQGFGVPLSHWFKTFLGDDLLKLCEEIPSPLSVQFVKQLVDNHKSGRYDMSLRLWQLYSYLLWKDLGKI